MMARSPRYPIPLRCWVRVPVRRSFIATVNVPLLLLLQRSGTCNVVMSLLLFCSSKRLAMSHRLLRVYTSNQYVRYLYKRRKRVAYAPDLRHTQWFYIHLWHELWNITTKTFNLQSLVRLAPSLLQLSRFDVILLSMQISPCGCPCDLSHLLKLRVEDIP